MPNFVYEGVTEAGKKVKGVVRASNKQAAISDLRGKGYMIRSVQEKAETMLDKELNIGRAVKLEDFVVFCRQFATLIRSGIQIDQALKIMEDQTVAKRLKAAIGDVHEQVRNGHPLSKAMGEHPRIFPEMFVNMVASGETGGNLDEVLDRMALHYEKENNTVQKIKSAMTYPIVVLIMAVVVVVFLLLKIVPTFATMFEEQGAELPWITRFVMGASYAVAHYWWAFVLIVAGIVAAFKVVGKNENGRYALDAVKFKIPIFGIVMKKAAIARMSRTMSSLFVSAVPMLQALDITEKVIGNQVMAKVVKEAKASLQQGKQLSEPFSNSGLFPEMVLQMLYIGEETGQIDHMLAKVADFYEADVDQSVDRLKALLEPLMMLILSGIVGFIVASIMTPMFKMYENFLG